MCDCWAGEGEPVLERFWGVREAACCLERLCQTLLRERGQLRGIGLLVRDLLTSVVGLP